MPIVIGHDRDALPTPKILPRLGIGLVGDFVDSDPERPCVIHLSLSPEEVDSIISRLQSVRDNAPQRKCLINIFISTDDARSMIPAMQGIIDRTTLREGKRHVTP